MGLISKYFKIVKLKKEEKMQRKKVSLLASPDWLIF